MKNILRYFKQETKLCVLSLCLAVITAILGVIQPRLTAQMVEALSEKKLDNVAVWGTAIAIISISSTLVSYFASLTGFKLRTRVGRAISKEICSKVLNVKTIYLDKFKRGELINVIEEDAKNLVEYMQNLAKSCFSIITCLGVVVIIETICWQCLVVYLLFAFCIFSFQKYSLKKERESTEKSKTTNDTATSLLSQIFEGMNEIKCFNMKQEFSSRFNNLLDEEIAFDKATFKANASNRRTSSILFDIFTLVLIFVGVWSMSRGELSVPNFITIYMYKGYLSTLIFTILNLRSMITEMKIVSVRINKILQIEDNKLESFGNNEKANLRVSSLILNGVSFSYDRCEILKNVSLKFATGQFYGIVGESGSAKTTLIKLLSGLLEPNAGSITIDGLALKSYSEKCLTSLIALVSQEPFIFSFSIRENLLMVKPEATEEEIWRALEDSQIADFVKSLPNGVDTFLTENLNISGGQKQRLALARVFLKDPAIILLDEATSALDNQTQAKIIEVIRTKAKQRQRIFVCIAHRIETVQDADEIIFLSDGRVIETGTHDQLTKDWRYRNLLNKPKTA